jgi:Domain of unknown function (DUF1992)
MTERKPPEKSYSSWIDQQIVEAEKRGVFDNLPGTGKPIPPREQTDYTQAWLREYLRREGVSTEELLPTPLRLRKESERLTAALPGLTSEQAVRDTVGQLNRRIMDWRRNSIGPPIFVPLVDEETMVSRWEQARPADLAGETGLVAADRESPDTAAAPRRRWRRVGRLRRR